MTSGSVVSNGSGAEVTAPAAAAAPAQPPLAIPGLPLDRPELHVGAAFVGGLLLATVLKRFAR
ncbi:MAG TPA: hypothetical protein VGM91_24100 [Conexibacter sp.]